MWTIFRFALSSAAEPCAYDEAYAILQGAGFFPARPPRRACGAFPGAVMGYVCQDPAVVTRSIFETLGEARLRPVGVTGAPLAGAPEAARRPRASA